MKRFVGYILASLIVASLFIAIEAAWDYFHAGFEPLGEYVVDAVILAVAFFITDLVMQYWDRRR